MPVEVGDATTAGDDATTAGGDGFGPADPVDGAAHPMHVAAITRGTMSRRVRVMTGIRPGHRAG